MRSRMVVLGVMLGLAHVALAADGSFERRLQVKGPVLLSVETNSGYVHVLSGTSTEVHVVAHVHAGQGWGLIAGGSAEDRVKAVLANPPVTQTGNIISVGKGLKVQNVSIDYEVTTPRGTDLRVNTGSGDVRVSDVRGPAEVKTGSGGVDAMGLNGRVDLETGSGDIRAEMLSSQEVTAQTGSGRIGLQDVGGSLWAHTGSGEIKVSGRPTGTWKIETGSGGVELDSGGAGFSLDAETGSGSVDVAGGTSVGSDKHHMTAEVHGGGPQVRVVTGSGDVRVR